MIDESDGLQSLQIKRRIVAAVFAVYTLFFVATLALFLRRASTAAIRRRSVSLSAASSISGWIMLASYFAVEMEWPYPCFLSLWTSAIFSVLWIFTFVARCARLLVLSYYNRQVAEATLRAVISKQSSAISNTGHAAQRFQQSHELMAMTSNDIHAYQWNPHEFAQSKDPLFDSLHCFLKPPPNATSAPTPTQTHGSFTRSSTPTQTITRHISRESRRRGSMAFISKKYASTKFLWMCVGSAMLVVIAYTAVIQAITTSYALDLHKTEPDCGSFWEFLHVYCITGCICAVAFPTFLWLLNRHVIRHDTYGMRRDMIISMSFLIPIYITYGMFVFVFDVHPGLQGRAKTLFSPNYLALMAVTIVHITGIVIPIYRSFEERSFLGQRHMSWQTFMRSINSPETWSYMKSTLAKDFCAELGVFIDSYRDLADKLRECRSTTFEIKRGSFLHLSNEFQYISSIIIPSSNAFNHSFKNPIILLRRRSMGETSPAHVTPVASVPSCITPPPSPSLSIDSSQSTTLSIPPISLEKQDPAVPRSLLAHYRSFYTTFIIDGAPLQVNLTSDIIHTIKMKVDMDDWTVGMFDDAARAVLDLIRDVRTTRSSCVLSV